jgi:hypothetical protein
MITSRPHPSYMDPQIPPKPQLKYSSTDYAIALRLKMTYRI